MDVKRYELKKIVTSKAMWALVIIFTLYNIYNISSYYKVKKGLDYFNDMVSTVGYEINNEMISELKVYYDDNFKEASKVIKEKTGNEYSCMAECLAYSKNRSILEGIEIIERTNLIESYYMSIPSKDKEYKEMNIREIVNLPIMYSKISGEALEVLDDISIDAERRFNEILENQEHRNLFPNSVYKLLFDDILYPVIIQISALVVLMGAYILNYEFENKTHLVVYTTKRGRKVIKDKLFVAGIMSVIITTIMLSIVLIISLSVFDFSKIWNIPISSYFNYIGSLPNMSWINITFLQALILIIIAVYIIEIIFTLIVFALSNIIRNTYMNFIMFIIISGIGLEIFKIVPRYSKLIFLAVCTPFRFIYGLSNRYIIDGTLTEIKNYEIITLGAWLLVFTIITYMLIKRFKKVTINN